MIFVDASAFLRYLIQPVTPHDQISERQAASFVARVDAGVVEVTTSEAILQKSRSYRPTLAITTRGDRRRRPASRLCCARGGAACRAKN